MRELAIAYCRVSTKEQEEKGLSLDAQEDYIREWIKSNGCDLVRVFKVQESARTTERKHLKDAFRYCVENGIKQILISDSDRWTRNRELDMEARKFLEQNGLSVYLIRDQRFIPGFKSAAERLGHNVKVDVDAYVSDIIREKSLAGTLQKLKKGEYPGTPSLGYRSITKTKISPHKNIQTNDAPKVKRLLELFNTGKFTVRQTIKLAKDIGLKPRRKDEFTVGAMAKLIKRRYYYGEFEYSHPWINGGEPKVYENKTTGFEPIITKEIWEQNQAILKKRQTNFKGHNKRPYLFNNLMCCGKCGGLIFGVKPDYKVSWKTKNSIKVKKYAYETHYICNKNSYYTTNGSNVVWKDYVDTETMTIKEDITYEGNSGERKVWLKKGTIVETQKCDMPYYSESELEKMLMDEIGLIKFNKRHWQEVKDSLFKDETKEFLDYEIRSLRSEMTKNEIRLDEMYEDYRKEVIDTEFFKTRTERLRERQKEVKDRLNELEEDREMHDEKIGKAVEILDSLKNWEMIFRKADREKKNHLVRLLTSRVSTTYNKKEIRGKMLENKNLAITYEPEVEELFELGILEKSKKFEKENPNFGLVPSFFNSPKFRDG